MNTIEKFASKMRHSQTLANQALLWNLIRPIYNLTLKLIYFNGLSRTINGTDRIRICAELRNSGSEYEPDVWKHLMSNLKKGDTVVDVGANIGLYAIAIAKHVGSQGRVVAIEPNEKNFKTLKQHIRLNKTSDNTTAIKAACGEKESMVHLSGGGLTASVSRTNDMEQSADSVRCLSLDGLNEKKIDIIKIDVEGYEDMVLRGAERLLSDPNRKPRLIYLEVHPFAWADIKKTGEFILSTLKQAGYSVADVEGSEVTSISEYGEVVAQSL